ncbi:hypothetical protein [Ereboglobus luteus]|uniref:hypothetical protein n=1 Tax=Ereboglobus luteus TaxID=1796921 RepID=UPI0012601669|nr:hypothetical protein [Ereboglobus luteus]
MKNKTSIGERASVRPTTKNTPASVSNTGDAAKASRRQPEPFKASAPSAHVQSRPAPPKPGKSKGTPRKRRLESFTVRMSPQQARLIRRFAAVLRATPSDMLASLALSEIAHGGNDHSQAELDCYNSALIELIVQRRVPEDRSSELVGFTHVCRHSARKDGGA